MNLETARAHVASEIARIELENLDKDRDELARLQEALRVHAPPHWSIGVGFNRESLYRVRIPKGMANGLQRHYLQGTTFTGRHASQEI